MDEQPLEVMAASIAPGGRTAHHAQYRSHAISQAFMADPDQNELHARLDLAHEVILETCELINRFFAGRDELAVDRKTDDSPVTAADKEAEQYLRMRIGDAFPKDGILGEEFGETKTSSPWRWVLDPIDGTKSFVHGVPLFGTLIGVQFNAQSVIGLIAIPALGELVFAGQGCGAWWQHGKDSPVRAKVDAGTSLAEGLLCTSDFEGFALTDNWDTLHRLQQAAGLVRTWGDAYGYVLVATGRATAMIDPRLNAWDIAPMPVIMNEAGGTFSDWEGTSSINSGHGLAAHPQVARELLSLIGGSAG
ncbi:MAG: inositol monophosphatase [Pirellulales bacterium]|nr:inositol monophosphatase [Pirellulales bacterium]